MKQIKEILILIKEEFNRGDYSGICGTAYSLWCYKKITIKEYHLWKDYWGAYARTRNVFYNSKGEKTPDKTEYVWIPNREKPRNNWLDKRIFLNK